MQKRTSLFALAALMLAGTAAQAADLAPPPPPPAPEIRPAVSDWTGPYLGVVGGGTCLDTEHDVLQDTDKDGDPDVILADLPLNGCGLHGGFVTGFNYQIDSMVFGLEGDWTWGGRTGEHTDTSGGVIERDHYKIKWQATLRARIGVLASDQTLFYLTGGIAWLRGTARQTQPLQFDDTNTHTGYVVGGGVEHALTDNIHLRAEYLYSSYKSKKYGTFVDPDPAEPNVDLNIGLDHVHTFRAGVTWNFPVSTW